MVEDVDISVDVWMLESVRDGVDIGVVVVNTGLEYLDDDLVVGSAKKKNNHKINTMRKKKCYS